MRPCAPLLLVLSFGCGGLSSASDARPVDAALAADARTVDAAREADGHTTLDDGGLEALDDAGLDASDAVSPADVGLADEGVGPNGDAAAPDAEPSDASCSGCAPLGAPCLADEACASGACACATPDCASRFCASRACPCAIVTRSGTCGAAIDDGLVGVAGCAAPRGCYGGACLAELPAPAAPSPPQTIGDLTVTIRTSSLAGDGTDEVTQLCLTSTRCFTLELGDDLDEHVAGRTDVFQLHDLHLPRAAVDRVELRVVMPSGADRWVPACVALAFDGEPVHCAEPRGVSLGDPSASWADPLGLHVACASCQGKHLTHGPMVGALDPDRLRVWVRTDATRSVSLHLSGSSSTADPPAVAWVQPLAARDFTGVLEVGGLEPGRSYSYWVDVEGRERTPVHRITTPPPVGQRGTFDLQFSSCVGRTTPQTLLAQLARLSPDMFLFIGDNHYANSVNREVHRYYYRRALEEPSRAAFIAEIPTLAVWDDHDFVGNNSWGDPRYREPIRATFTEYWANPAFGDNGEGVYFQQSFGDVDVFMLDARYFRDRVTGPVIYGDPQGRRSMLGPAQTTWLLDRLAASTATFKIVADGSAWTAEAPADAWSTFLPARDAIFDAIRDRGVEGVVLLSGDAHHAQFRLISRTASAAYDLPELIASPLAHNNSSCPRPSPELRLCVTRHLLAIHLGFDTTLADPTMTATIYGYDVNGGTFAPYGSWTITRSSLSL